MKAESAQRQDLFYAELLALLDEVPVELSFFETETKNQTSKLLDRQFIRII